MKKGEAKKTLRRNKGRQSKINPKCPFLEGNRFFAITSKERKGKKGTKQQTNKEGLVPSEVALWATSPDPQTLQNNRPPPPKKKRKQKRNKEGLGTSEVALRATSPDP